MESEGLQGVATKNVVILVVTGILGGGCTQMILALLRMAACVSPKGHLSKILPPETSQIRPY